MYFYPATIDKKYKVAGWYPMGCSYFHILVQAACVRHPWWRMEAKLALVFTYFLSFSTPSAFHFGDTQEAYFFLGTDIFT